MATHESEQTKRSVADYVAPVAILDVLASSHMTLQYLHGIADHLVGGFRSLPDTSGSGLEKTL
jgi:hypothetical protein